MIITYKTKEEYVYAYITWSIIHYTTNKMSDEGETISIGGAWVHPDYRHLGVLKSLISDLFHHHKNQDCLYVLLSSEKHKNRPNRLTPIMKYFKYIKGIGGSNGKRNTRDTARNYC